VYNYITQTCIEVDSEQRILLLDQHDNFAHLYLRNNAFYCNDFSETSNYIQYLLARSYDPDSNKATSPITEHSPQKLENYA